MTEGEPGTVAVTAVDYAFEGVPATMAAGSTLELTNASDVELHELVAFRLPDDVDISVGDLLAMPEEESDAILGDGPPATVLVAPPGEDGSAVMGDGTLSEPGRYALVCFIPTGADPDEFLAAMDPESEGPPDVEGGPPHAANGMFAETVVE